jgi:hypothetical protein
MADAPTARLVLPAAEGIAKLFGTTPIFLRVGPSVVVAQRAVERLVLPKDVEAPLADLWPPTSCVETEVPRVIRCEHTSGAFFASLPLPSKSPPGQGKNGR